MDITSYLLGKQASGGGGGGSDVDWSAIGYSGTPQSDIIGYNYAKQIYDNWDSTQTSLNFKNNYNLTYMPLVDTSNISNCTSAFENCRALINVPLLNLSNCTSCTKMFCSCSALQSVAPFNLTRNTGGNYTSMFEGCSSLTTIPEFNVTVLYNMSFMFRSCSSLTTIPLLDCSQTRILSSAFSYCTSLTNLGGFKDLGKNYLTNTSANYSNYTLDLSASTNITHDSLMNVINNLYDIATKGCQPQQLVLGNTNLAKLTAEEIAIATNKGWNVS